MTTQQIKQRFIEFLDCSPLARSAHSYSDLMQLLRDCRTLIEELTTPIERAKRVLENGPKTLDAKWLDPECWDGCQSLVYKNKNTQLQQHIEELEKRNHWLGVEVSHRSKLTEELQQRIEELETQFSDSEALLLQQSNRIRQLEAQLAEANKRIEQQEQQIEQLTRATGDCSQSLETPPPQP